MVVSVNLHLRQTCEVIIDLIFKFLQSKHVTDRASLLPEAPTQSIITVISPINAPKGFKLIKRVIYQCLAILGRGRIVIKGCAKLSGE